MCPSFLATRDEKDSTRGRARVLQELANGSLVSGWDAPEVAEALDLCLSCKGCSADCPAGVDMATYKAEALYQRYRRRLRPASHYSLGWLPRWAALTARSPRRPRLANASLRVPPVGGARQAARRHRPPPRPAAVRAAELPPLVRGAVTGAASAVTSSASTSGTPASAHPLRGARSAQARAAVGGHVHQRVHARRSARPPSRCSRPPATRSASRGAAGLLRPHLDIDRPARRRPPPAAPDAARARPGARRGHPRRRPRAVLHRGAARRRRRTAARRQARRGPGRRGQDPRRAAHRHRRLDAARPVGRHRRRAAALPPARACSAGPPTRRCCAAAGASVSAVGGCCGLAGNFGVERGHYDVSVAVAETALLPAVRARASARRCSPTASPAAPSSTSSPASPAPTWPSCSPPACELPA